MNNVVWDISEYFCIRGAGGNLGINRVMLAKNMKANVRIVLVAGIPVTETVIV